LHCYASYLPASRTNHRKTVRIAHTIGWCDGRSMERKMSKYLIGWLFGIPVVVLVVTYLLMH
jgi:hypothetical protein